MIAAAWLSAKLLTKAGAIGLVIAAVLVAVMLGAVGALLWVNASLRDDIGEAQEAMAFCTSSLETSRGDVSALKTHLDHQNEAVEAFADECRAADEKPAVEALHVLKAPKEPRRFPEGAEGMNEWLASK